MGGAEMLLLLLLLLLLRCMLLLLFVPKGEACDGQTTRRQGGHGELCQFVERFPVRQVEIFQ